MKKIIVFASGSKIGGGSGFQELVENSQTGVLNAKILAVISNYADGGVMHLAQKLGIPFIHFIGPWQPDQYQKIFNNFQPDLVSLSGWLKPVRGLDPRTTINIHPGPLPDFGGLGMYGHHVHQAVFKAYRQGRIKSSAVTMHFVTENYDEGPIFFQYPVQIRNDDTPDTLAFRVNQIEHGWQAWITNLVVQGQISWDGQHPKSLIVPSWYSFHKPI